MVEGCSLSPEWPEQGDNGRPHGTTPVKPIPPAQESAPVNDGDVPAMSKEAGIRMNTAPPIRIQYS